MTPINNRKPPASADWRTYPLEKWNVTTFSSFLSELTREKFNVDYAPSGVGPKSQRWSMERGMMKQAQGKYGNAVLRKFIEICVDEYQAKPDYPYASFTFMYSYLDRNFAKAQQEIAQERRNDERASEVNSGVSDDELSDWL